LLHLLALERGVVDEDVDPAELAGGRVDDAGAVRLLGQVPGDQHRPPAGSLDHALGLARVLVLVPVRDHDVRPFAREREGDGTAVNLTVKPTRRSWSHVRRRRQAIAGKSRRGPRTGGPAAARRAETRVQRAIVLSTGAAGIRLRRGPPGGGVAALCGSGAADISRAFAVRPRPRDARRPLRDARARDAAR